MRNFAKLFLAVLFFILDEWFGVVYNFGERQKTIKENKE